jgi:hypothetical protein
MPSGLQYQVVEQGENIYSPSEFPKEEFDFAFSSGARASWIFFNGPYQKQVQKQVKKTRDFLLVFFFEGGHLFRTPMG